MVTLIYVCTLCNSHLFCQCSEVDNKFAVIINIRWYYSLTLETTKVVNIMEPKRWRNGMSTKHVVCEDVEFATKD